MTTPAPIALCFGCGFAFGHMHLIREQEISTPGMTPDERTAWEAIPPGAALCDHCFNTAVAKARQRREGQQQQENTTDA